MPSIVVSYLYRLTLNVVALNQHSINKNSLNRLKSSLQGLNRHEIRSKIRATRRAIPAAEQDDLGQQACTLMLAQLESLTIKHIALYLTNDGELDTQPLIKALWQRNINVYLPRLHPFSKGNLLFLAYTSNTQIQRNKLGIDEPLLDIRHIICAEHLDVIVTPLVAFDTDGNRMGMGGGYYDRTLAHYKDTRSPLPIGYAHDCQQVNRLPSEHWDIPLPIIITPTKRWQFDHLG
ncbi:5-formyltetrahydrofolate cyclo-ligase [Shewanella sp. VB17]|uniref:5-formyltetrahydrofolate cyclo-ligase n=1 Tax=Shewanella sp. VB17 TaxID=2739432 RepID=UPI00156649DC|nr:5-formyltetrahydrofolate cyclo-ligase [Shewanella sp. VB17]NRD73216.1 5-formyltetrahydrofolate cyclo-ligase [Shewanella sp. VB17]